MSLKVGILETLFLALCFGLYFRVEKGACVWARLPRPKCSIHAVGYFTGIANTSTLHIYFLLVTVYLLYTVQGPRSVYVVYTAPLLHFGLVESKTRVQSRMLPERQQVLFSTLFVKCVSPRSHALLSCVLPACNNCLLSAGPFFSCRCSCLLLSTAAFNSFVNLILSFSQD